MNLAKLQDTKLIDRNLLHFYTLTTLAKRENKETVPCIIDWKRIEYPGINLPKEAKDHYSANGETLMKELEDNTNMGRNTVFLGWKDQYCQNDHITQSRFSCIGGQVLYHQHHLGSPGNLQTNAILINIPMAFFTELEERILKFLWKYKKPPNTQNKLEKEEQSWKNHCLPDFRLYYKATVIKMIWCWQKKTDTQISGTEIAQK